MFSKSKINDPIDPRADSVQPNTPDRKAIGGLPAPNITDNKAAEMRQSTRQQSSSGSFISPDLKVEGNLTTTGNLQVAGTIQGDIRATHLTIDESATIQGEIIADEVVVNGRVEGRLRGAKVRLSSTAQVVGDILHQTIAIEAGAHFEGSVQRSEQPLGALKDTQSPQVVNVKENPKAAVDAIINPVQAETNKAKDKSTDK